MNKTTIFITTTILVILGVGGLLFLYFQKSIVPLESIPPINTPPMELYNINDSLNLNETGPEIGNTIIDTNSSQPDYQPVTISISNFSFIPSQLIVKIGTTVTWVNDDQAPHTITSLSFSSQTLNTGNAFSYTFNQSGIFDYYCSIHPSMKGQIIVQ